MSEPSDRELLRRFEPVIRYTRGERFFPMAVEPYLQQSSLWKQRPNADAICLVPDGQLTADKLAEPRMDDFDTIYFLKFIEPLDIVHMAAYALQAGMTDQKAEDKFRAGRGRLARVGYSSRFVDALFSITLLARGRVPGDTAAAASIAYQQIMATQAQYHYYGRVVRREGWIALQYWFFYAFNNWRSGFFGVNDHESDWEMIYLYLAENATGEVTPAWVAYASHDFAGDDLRRRWDDPEVEKVGEHPVIYAGAGSHASYFARGEYLAEIELPFLSPLVRLVDNAQKIGRRILRTTQGGVYVSTAPTESFNVFRIPFVDYARGDGLTLGPGQAHEWGEPGLLDPPPAWALNYRGLWGLYARDPISGENAPAGPLYNRDGTLRRSWSDPLGWAGLDKVTPPATTLARLREQQQLIAKRRAALMDKIADKQQELTGLELEAAALRQQPHLKKLYLAHEEKIAVASKTLQQFREQLITDDTLHEALERREAHLQTGQPDPARAHLRRAHHPASDVNQHLSFWGELWAAISIGLMMFAVVGLTLAVRFGELPRGYLLFGLVALLTMILFVEAGFRRQLPRLITSATDALAIIAALVLLYEFFWPIVILSILAAGTYIMWENLRELQS